MTNSLEGLKLQFEVLMAEYQQLKGGISNYRQIQSQLDSLSLAGLGVALSLILLVLDRNPQNIGVILLFPILFYAVAFTQLRHERLLYVAAMYIDSELRPQIEEVLSRLSKKDTHVLGHERFLADSSWAKNIVLEWLATTSRAIVSLAIAIGIAIVYFYVRLVPPSPLWNPYETWLLVVNALLLGVNLIISFFIARTRFHYMNQYYKNGKKEA